MSPHCIYRLSFLIPVEIVLILINDLKLENFVRLWILFKLLTSPLLQDPLGTTLAGQEKVHVAINAQVLHWTFVGTRMSGLLITAGVWVRGGQESGSPTGLY